MYLNLPEETLYIDSKDSHQSEENAISIHPSKMHLLNKFQKESFDKVIIRNSATECFNSIGFFNILMIMKPNTFCEVYIDQPLVMMQKIDAEQIENFGKRGGFKDIQVKPFERWEKKNGLDVKISTLVVSMHKTT